MNGRESARSDVRNVAQIADLPASGPGQQYPCSCPAHCPHPDAPGAQESASRLGAPLSIADAARLIGCSPWTVRQRLIPSGLPVFRSRSGGKLIFYRKQLERWIEKRQQT